MKKNSIKRFSMVLKRQQMPTLRLPQNKCHLCVLPLKTTIPQPSLGITPTVGEGGEEIKTKEKTNTVMTLELTCCRGRSGG